MKTVHLLLLTLIFIATHTVHAQDVKIYVSDAENFAANSGKILQYDIDGSNPQTFIDEELSWPQDIVFLADRNEVLISNLNSNRITKYNASTGAYIADFATVAGGPTRMEIGPDGLLYVIQWSTTDNKVLRFELDGTPAGEYTDVGVARSIGIAWDATGNLYISSFSQANVTRFDTNGMSTGEFIDNAQLSGPTNIFFDNNGDLFVFDWNAGDVERYNNNGTHLGTFITDVGQVEGVDFLANGNILLGHGSDASVKQYLSDGTLVGSTVPSGSGGLEQPNAVVLFDRSTLGNDDFEVASLVLVTPSIGSQFTLFNEGFNTVDRLQIYDTTGRLVTELDTNNLVWNASQMAEGVYFVVANNGVNKRTQKIIVKQ